MRGIHAGRIGWHWQEGSARSLQVISLAMGASYLALFLCILASVFGKHDGASWFALPPDYTHFGWAVRLTGGLIGIGTVIYLSRLQQGYRSRRKRRSFPGRLIQAGILISIVSITWEIAILAAVVIGVVVFIYTLFGEDGI